MIKENISAAKKKYAPACTIYGCYKTVSGTIQNIIP